MKDRCKSRPPRRIVIGFVALAIVGTCGWDRANAQTTYDFGAQQVNVPVTQTGHTTSGAPSNCSTEITGYSTDPLQNFTITYPKTGSNLVSCHDYVFNSSNNGTTCYFYVTFNPQSTGTDALLIAPQQTGTCDLGAGIDTYGAGVTLTPSLNAPEPSPTPTISVPSDFAALELNPNSPFSEYSSITFDSGDASVKWTPKLQYQTVGKLPKIAAEPSPAPTPFTTDATPITLGFGTPIPGASPTPTGDYQVAGGLMTIQAKYSASPPAHNDPVTNTMQIWMTGVFPSTTGIPYADITNQLDTTLYSTVTLTNDSSFNSKTDPETPELMAQVASVESNYKQFSNEDLNGVVESWPNESYPVYKKENGKRVLVTPQGAHIGLTQVPVNMMDAWDWLQNTKDGVLWPGGKANYSFEYKLYHDYKLFSNSTVLATHPGLLGLNSCQLEEMALESNGPHPGTVASQQYYVPQKVNGSYQWAINMKNICGVCYVTSVRNTTPFSLPHGSSPSSCSAMDPPSPSSITAACNSNFCPLNIPN